MVQTRASSRKESNAAKSSDASRQAPDQPDQRKPGQRGKRIPGVFPQPQPESEIEPDQRGETMDLHSQDKKAKEGEREDEFMANMSRARPDVHPSVYAQYNPNGPQEMGALSTAAANGAGIGAGNRPYMMAYLQAAALNHGEAQGPASAQSFDPMPNSSLNARAHITRTVVHNTLSEHVYGADFEGGYEGLSPFDRPPTLSDSQLNEFVNFPQEDEEDDLYDDFQGSAAAIPPGSGPVKAPLQADQPRKRETAEDIRRNMAFLASEPALPTDDEFNYMHRRRDGTLVPMLTTNKPFQHQYWYQHEDPAANKSKGKKLYNNQAPAGNHSSGSQSMGQPAASAGNVERGALDTSGYLFGLFDDPKTTESANATTLEDERNDYETLFQNGLKEYDEAYERNLLEMMDGPDCICNKGNWKDDSLGRGSAGPLPHFDHCPRNPKKVGNKQVQKK